MRQEDVVAFRAEAFSRHLAQGPMSRPTDGKTYFYLDINQGGLYVEAEPFKLMALIQLARHFARRENYGEHNAILQLVASRRVMDGESKIIYCHRPYHVRPAGPHTSDASCVRLEDWLAERGLPYVRINEAQA